MHKDCKRLRCFRYKTKGTQMQIRKKKTAGKKKCTFESDWQDGFKQDYLKRHLARLIVNPTTCSANSASSAHCLECTLAKWVDNFANACQKAGSGIFRKWFYNAKFTRWWTKQCLASSTGGRCQSQACFRFLYLSCSLLQPQNLLFRKLQYYSRQTTGLAREKYNLTTFPH